MLPTLFLFKDGDTPSLSRSNFHRPLCFEKVQPAMHDRARVNFFQGPGIKLQLWFVDFHLFRQLIFVDLIRLEIHNPDFLWQKRRQIRDALNDNKFAGEF